MNKELYKFGEASIKWHYTSSDDEVEHDGITYTPITMGRTNIESKNQIAKENIEISFAIDNQMARKFMISVPEHIVTLTLFVKNDDSTYVAWKGRLASVKPEKNKIILIFENIFTSLKRPGLRASFQLTCRHTLYGPGCNVDKDLHALPSTAVGFSGYTLNVPAAASRPNGYYVGGIIEDVDGAYTVGTPEENVQGGMRFITGHVGSTLTVMRRFEVLEERITSDGGAPVRLFPGCPRTRDVCSERFSNLLNFGGFPFIPPKNPFDGTAIDN